LARARAPFHNLALTPSNDEPMTPSHADRPRPLASHGRVLWRILAIGLPVFALDAGLQLALQRLWRQPGLPLRAAAVLAVAVAGSIALAWLYAFLVRRVEKRAVDELGRAGATAEALRGWIAGSVLFSLVVAWVAATGRAQVGGFEGLAEVAPLLAASLVAGVGEELVFRGAVFRPLDEQYGLGVALAASALLFGGVHATNPGATWTSVAAIALEAGVMLALVYKATGRLWMAIGLHFGWDFTEGGLFGATVSGEQAHGIFSVRLADAQPLWTGGLFGLESSLPAVVVCLVAALLAGLSLRRNAPPA
jgi:uncharacterized protein